MCAGKVADSQRRRCVESVCTLKPPESLLIVSAGVHAHLHTCPSYVTISDRNTYIGHGDEIGGIFGIRLFAVLLCVDAVHVHRHIAGEVKAALMIKT